MADDVKAIIIRQLERQWPRKWAGAAWAALVGASVLISSAGWDLADARAPQVAWTALATAAAAALWWQSNRKPRIPKGKIGVLIALRCDNQSHESQVKADFVAALKMLLGADHARNNIRVIEYSSVQSEEIVDGATALTAMAEARAHLVVFGQARQRLNAGAPSHVLDVQIGVRHRRLEPEVQRTLATELSSVMPGAFQFPRANEVEAFRITLLWVELTARYTLGLAALASGDLDYAQAMLVDLHQRVRSPGPQVQGAQLIAARINRPLAALFDARAVRAMGAHLASGLQARLEDAERYASQVVIYDSGHYRSRVALAYCAFTLRRDVKVARQHLKKCEHVSDSAWRYSEAFLFAYEGKLSSAQKSYRQAISVTKSNLEIPRQVDEYIRGVLLQEPDRFGLEFARMLINQHVLKHDECARECATRFLHASPKNLYARERALAATIAAPRLPPKAA
jgi:tetratricopeptide (TPR) repeat protein